MSSNVDFSAALWAQLSIKFAVDATNQQAWLQTFNISEAPFDWSTFPDGALETDDDFIRIKVNNEQVSATGLYLKTAGVPAHSAGLQSTIDYVTGNIAPTIIPATPDVWASTGITKSYTNIQLDILLEAPNSVGTVVNNYYSANISNLIPDANGTAKVRRSMFVRVGSGAQDWSTVYGFRVTVSGSSTANVYLLFPTSGNSEAIFGNTIANATYTEGLCFVGGSRTRTGYYEYAQLNVNRSSSYVAKSELSLASTKTFCNTNKVYLALEEPTDSQVNEIWVYRRGEKLNEWYRIGIVAAGDFTDPYFDVTTDEEALDTGIRVNLNLKSIQSITEDIYAILGPIFGRWYYFTAKFMYPSDLNDPDLVDVSQAIRITGSNSEIFLWACTVNESVVLVGTSCDIYILTGTYITLPDNVVDVYYRPLGVQYPPISQEVVSYGSQAFYLGSDGWRTVDQEGNNPLLTAPNIDRLYQGETCHGYFPVDLTIVPGSTKFPVTIGKNKLWCMLPGVDRIEIFDFIRKYWRPLDYGLGAVSACTFTQDGKILAFYEDDLKLREIDSQTSNLIDGATAQVIDVLCPIQDGSLPKNRKDSYTAKVRCYTGAASTLALSIIKEDDTEVAIGTLAAATTLADLPFDISTLVGVNKTWQVKIVGTAPYLTLEDVTIDYDPRPVQLSYLRIPATNYGTAARKRVYEVPFEIDTLGINVTFTPMIDGVDQTSLTVNTSRKQTYSYKFPAVGTDVLKGVDYEYKISAAAGGLFEFMGFPKQPKMEVFPDPIKSFVVPVWNGGNACKKRLRVWPFVLDPIGNTLTFTPIVDGIPLVGVDGSWVHNNKKTVRYQFTSDVFGVDYSGIFSSSAGFELWDIINPEIVQTLPIAKRFDQLGPEELFRYGRIKQFEYRVMPFGGTVIPYVIYFNDNSTQTGNITVTDGKEASYFVDVPKGTSGNIVRIVFGPTTFDFHRFYMRLQVFKTGKDTELEWISLPVAG
jgi:hypothetical protein